MIGALLWGPSQEDSRQHKTAQLFLGPERLGKKKKKISYSFSQEEATVIGVLGLCLIESQLPRVTAKKILHHVRDNKSKYEN